METLHLFEKKGVLYTFLLFHLPTCGMLYKKTVDSFFQRAL